MSRPLYGGCPLFGGSAIRGFTVSDWSYLTTDTPRDTVYRKLPKIHPPLISHSTPSVKLPFFQKAVVVVMIVDLVRIKDCKERREGDKLNIRANALFPLLPQSSVQKG